MDPLIVRPLRRTDELFIKVYLYGAIRQLACKGFAVISFLQNKKVTLNIDSFLYSSPAGLE